MKTETTKTTKVDFYESPFELLHDLETKQPHPSIAHKSETRKNERDNWHGGVNQDESVKLAKYGWTDAPRLSENGKGDGLRDYSQGQRVGTVAGVNGSFLDVGAFCAGEPECFQEFAPVETPRGITLGLNFGALCDINPQEMINRGTVLLAVHDELERAGFTVSIEAFWFSKGSQGSEFTLRFPIKEAGQRVDENQLAFWACHPSALRHLGFAWQEIQDESWVKKMNVKGTRGASATPAKMDGMDYIFNSANLPRDEAQTLAYYERTMREIEKMLAETN